MQISPQGISLTSIANDHYDKYLKSFARQVSAFGYAVIIGFGRDMNSPGHSWTENHAVSDTWIAAWRHVVSIFKHAGANNVTWLWTIQGCGRGVESPLAWWPGASYVDWIGIDGFYSAGCNNFETVFGSTVTAVRRITSQPILLSETKFAPDTNYPAQISQLLNGIYNYHLLGLVWFDAFARQTRRLEGRSGALLDFRSGLSGFNIP